MTYMYHATNKANLVGIRDVGMAPASKRPASTAMGATQKNRIDKHEMKRQDRFRMLLKELAALGYSHNTILQSTAQVEIAFSRDNFAVIDEFPYATGTGTYGPIPENKGVVAANVDLGNILTKYDAALQTTRMPTDKALWDEGTARREARVAWELGMKTLTTTEKSQLRTRANTKPLLDAECALIDTLDISQHSKHFLYRLSYAYEELVAENEQEITRHRVYLFAESQFKTEYVSYATHIAGGQYDALAILRVDLAHVVTPMVDVSQGNAATTKETINAAQIEYKIGVPLASVQDGSVFGDGWLPLRDYVLPVATPEPNVASSSQSGGVDPGAV